MRLSSIWSLCLLFSFFYPITSAHPQSLTTEDARELYNTGRQLQKNGNVHGAIEKYRASLSLNADYVEPMQGLAECFYLIGEYEEALRYVRLASKYDRNNNAIYTLEGRIRIGLGEIEYARTLFTDVLDSEPNNLEAQFGLAELDIAQGKLRNAATRYVETLKVSPASRKALISLAILYDELGESEIAQRYLELALQYHSDNPHVHYIAAKHLYIDKAYDSAEAHLLTALSLNENYIDARVFLGEVYFAQDRYQDTIQTMRRVLLDQRRHTLAWYILGLTYARSGQVADAVNSFSQALVSRYDDEISRIAFENLALEKLKIGDEVREKLAAYHMVRGVSYEERNYLDKALIEYRRALRLAPLSRDYRLAYASVYKAQGFPVKYLNELFVLANIGYEDTLIRDEIEIEQSKTFDYVSTQWELDQFALERDRYKLMLFNLSPKNVEIHPTSGLVLTEFYYDLLLYYSDLNVGFEQKTVASFEEGFRTARESQADLFILTHFSESERSIMGNCTVYLARSGSELVSISDVRTGNDRILTLLASLARQLHDALPLRGKILLRNFDVAVIDLGRLHGIAIEDKLLIVKRGTESLRSDSLAFGIDEVNVLGEFEVVKLDEAISEGIVHTKSFFDLVNPQDVVIFPPPEPIPIEPQTVESEDRGFFGRILGLIGL